MQADTFALFGVMYHYNSIAEVNISKEVELASAENMRECLN